MSHSIKVCFHTCFVLLIIAIIAFSQGRWKVDDTSTKQNVPAVLIDAGHGGEDGGATSCTGVLESHINLEISVRLNDLLNLLGIHTKMIRTTDISVYTEGNTIAAKKVSDLKQRAEIVNHTDNAFLVSIHQNYFSDSRYSGAQVFYSANPESKEFAQILQSSFISVLNPGSNRSIKKADGIFLMQKVTCPAVLIECGFLSNQKEENMLRDPIYQKKLCCVIACTISGYLCADTA